MNFLKRWKRNKPSTPADNPVARFSLDIYSDSFVFDMKGDEIKVGGALVTLMLRHKQAHHILNLAVEAANAEHARRKADVAIRELLTSISPN